MALLCRGGLHVHALESFQYGVAQGYLVIEKRIPDIAYDIVVVPVGIVVAAREPVVVAVVAHHVRTVAVLEHADGRISEIIVDGTVVVCAHGLRREGIYSREVGIGPVRDDGHRLRHLICGDGEALRIHFIHFGTRHCRQNGRQQRYLVYFHFLHSLKSDSQTS